MPHTYYNRELHGDYEMISVGDFELAEGGVIPNLELAVRKIGELNADKSNAILMPTWFSGTTKILEDVYIGKDHALNPEKYCLILINQIGNGLSTSPWNADESIRGPKFPKVRIEDDVKAQYKLLTEHFGIPYLQLVVGGSMGAQQTYEWAVRYPDFVKRAAPIAGYAKNTEHDFIFTQTLLDTLTIDPAFKGGNYESIESMKGALDRHADMWSVMGFNPEMYRTEAYKTIGFSSGLDFAENFVQKAFEPMDPNTLLTCGWKWQRGDVSRNTYGDIKAALGRIKAKLFVMPISTDMFFVLNECKTEQEMIPNSEWRPIETVWGHMGLFGMDPNYMAQVDKSLNELLAIEV